MSIKRYIVLDRSYTCGLNFMITTIQMIKVVNKDHLSKKLSYNRTSFGLLITHFLLNGPNNLILN